MPESVLKFALPVVPAAKAKHVGPDLVSHRCELGAKPEGEGVVFRRGMANEQGRPIRRFGDGIGSERNRGR